ncbi:MAG: pseudouridine synthase [Bacteroidia bacterium]|nr:pseudouridine synthase [Bacteroidia bacterium]
MNYRHRLLYYLVKKTGISYKQAKAFISEGNVSVDDTIVNENILLTFYSKVVLNQQLLSKTDNLAYLAYYKPPGIECTLNENIADNLKQQLVFIQHSADSGETTADFSKALAPLNAPEHGLHIALPNIRYNVNVKMKLFYAGRLDKASEGLLLLTNDGHLYNKIIAPDAHLPKTYEVSLEKPYDKNFLAEMEKGVSILNTITKPCKCEPVDDSSFKITLTQGMNRQIRRMCFALDNYVIKLKRLSIGEIELGALNKSEFRYLSPEEISYLQNL